MLDNKTYDPTKSQIAKIIQWSMNNQFLVLILCAVLFAWGILSIKQIPLDALPDLSDTQVIIKTEFAGQSPQIIEDLVTYPLSTTMLGLAKTTSVRGFSMFGTSFIYVIFEDNVDLYWARNRVSEAMEEAKINLPDSVKIKIDSDANGVGWIYQYALIDKSSKHSLADLRSLQDWFLKFELSTIEGVSEVASVGGFVKEYQILINPNLLRAYNIPLSKIHKAVASASKEVGGRVIEAGETEFIIRSKGYISNIEDLQNIVIDSFNGTPILLSDVTKIIKGPELRRGVVDLNGQGEVVSGIVIMRDGQNALSVIKKIKSKIAQLQQGLPEGVEIVTVYDRAPLIEKAVSYLSEKLIEEAIAVAIITLIFLLHVRSALVAIITLPLGVLIAFIIMNMQGITANIMSLGGIAIAVGAMIDASIVMVENAHRKLTLLPENSSQSERNKAIIFAAKEVGGGLFFSLLIITVSFMPVFALTGESYRLFSPLAFTKTYAMAAAAVLSITLVPVLMLLLIKGKIHSEQSNPINRFFINAYKPLLKFCIKRKYLAIAVSLILLASTIIPIKNTGSEFMPPLYEGELLYMPTTLPSISLTKAKELLQMTNRIIKSHPDVERVFGKAGRADTATDPAPITMIETWILLKDKELWREGMSIKKITKELNESLNIPGLVNSFGYPIKTRMDMISTGIRTPVGIKISGNDLNIINDIALKIEEKIKDVTGTRSVFANRIMDGKYIDIIPNRLELARYNISLDSFQMTVQTALGGMHLNELIEGRQRYNIMMRYERRFRETKRDLYDIIIPAPDGQYIPLSDLAEVKYSESAPVIKSENARLNGWVLVDIEDVDIGFYVENARKIIAQEIELPIGYSITWSGQFEQMMEAKERLNIAIPATIIIIFILLYIHFGKIDRTLIVMLSIPFGLIGGFWAIYLAGYNLSVAVGVGFIALAGIAAETAVIMLIYIDQQLRKFSPTNKSELFDAIMHGAVQRVRPKLMTVSAIIIGLLPIFLSDGIGSDIMRRIALPMIGGMLTTTILTLIIIPVICYIWDGRKLNHINDKYK